MSTYRICLLGALFLLAGCSTPPAKVYSPPPLPATPAPETTPAAVAVAPIDPVTPVAAMPAPSQVPEPVSMSAVSAPEPASAASRAIPAPRPAPAPKPASAAKAAVAAPAAVESTVVATASRSTISGHVSLVGSRGQQVAAGELADTLVYFIPAKGGARVKPGHFTVYTHNRDFSPEAMSVPTGSTVTFVNLDDVRHNVFSVTPGSSFNLGFQGSGEKASHAFGHAGVVLISCNVHRSMELDMLVVPTPYSSKVAADGSFSLQGLPAGSGKLYFWNPRAQPVSQPLVLPMSGAVSQKLIAIKPRMETQLNTGSRR